MTVTKDRILVRTEGRRARPSESITIEYGMWSFDPVRKDGKGTLIDSTARGPMTLRVEQGTVVAGIYEALMLVDGGMTFGERSIFTVTADSAFGDLGFPGVVKSNTTIVLYSHPGRPVLPVATLTDAPISEIYLLP